MKIQPTINLIVPQFDVLWLTPVDTLTLAVAIYAIMFIPLTGLLMVRRIERIAKRVYDVH